jgi:hypothetical protein
MAWKRGTSLDRSRSSPACLDWSPKRKRKRDFTPVTFSCEFLQHSPNACCCSALTSSYLSAFLALLRRRFDWLRRWYWFQGWHGHRLRSWCWHWLHGRYGHRLRSWCWHWLHGRYGHRLRSWCRSRSRCWRWNRLQGRHRNRLWRWYRHGLRHGSGYRLRCGHWNRLQGWNWHRLCWRFLVAARSATGIHEELSFLTTSCPDLGQRARLLCTRRTSPGETSCSMLQASNLSNTKWT